ncbi:MAG TPA: transposase [Pseudobacteroides sp.]|uniref:IS110 family transposase n=1 Tax=Pseudobacteroides sp. TaxID=1968840 RepID=UPI002F94F9E2
MLHPKMLHTYYGIDIHKNQHSVVAINCFSEKLGELTFPNKKQDFAKLISFVKKHTPQGITPVFALEDVLGNGRELAIFLLEKNYRVKYVNPSLSQSERKNQATINKSDSIDAECVANVLLNKLDSLPDAAPNDLHWALNELVTKRNTLVKNNVVLKNQIHTYLTITIQIIKAFSFPWIVKHHWNFLKCFRPRQN